MYSIDDMVVYGSTGVCRITDIRKLKNIRNADSDKLYYVLKPLYQNVTIYAPTDSDKVFMRPVISAEQAHQLIGMIPSVRAEAYVSSSTQQLTDHYKEAMQTHDCRDLVELTMSIYAKKQLAEQNRRKFGQIDETYMKQAEDLLFGELSVSLGIPKDEVAGYIEVQVNEAEAASGEAEK